MILADTNVVSEMMRQRPDQAVLQWASAVGEGDLTICAVTVEEVERGLLRLPEGRRRHQLRERWDRLLASYAETIVTYDLDMARATARVLVDAERAGREMSLADAQIAGCCLVGGLGLATRNTRDFEHVPGLELIDPFTSP